MSPASSTLSRILKSPCQTPPYNPDSPWLTLKPMKSPCPCLMGLPTGTSIGTKKSLEDELKADGGLSRQWCHDNKAKQECLQASYPFCHPRSEDF